eukprot:3433220-Amphidinium_carterae.1
MDLYGALCHGLEGQLTEPVPHGEPKKYYEHLLKGDLEAARNAKGVRRSALADDVREAGDTELKPRKGGGSGRSAKASRRRSLEPEAIEVEDIAAVCELGDSLDCELDSDWSSFAEDLEAALLDESRESEAATNHSKKLGTAARPQEEVACDRLRLCGSMQKRKRQWQFYHLVLRALEGQDKI